MAGRYEPKRENYRARKVGRSFYMGEVRVWWNFYIWTEVRGPNGKYHIDNREALRTARSYLINHPPLWWRLRKFLRKLWRAM